ncbi:MAG: hypothetical protein RI885_1820 [Actinomycetota bacterium]|jgi:membrane-associated phospholipid phosphatase
MGKAVDLRRRGLIIAATAGGGVLAVTLVQTILTSFAYVVGGFAYSSSVVDILGVMVQGAFAQSLTSTLPFGVGVFLSLWQLAPIAAPLKFFHVVARSVLAAGVGAACVLLVGIVVGTAAGLSAVADLTFFGSSFPLGETGASLAAALAAAVQRSIQTFVTQVPLVVLAGLLVWLWARGRDRVVDLEGALDL